MIRSLRALHVRCFESLSLELKEGGSLFVGANAQGKTSILEAVCLLMRLQSPRAKRMKPIAKVGESGFGVAGRYLLDDDEQDLKLQLTRGGLAMAANGESIKTQSDYLSRSGLVVWMGNGDIELVQGSAGGRRHFLDFLCSQIDAGYRQALSRYRRVLKARNLLLKEGARRQDEITAYGEVLVEYGGYMTRVRRGAVEVLQTHAAAAQKAIARSDEVLALEYVSGAGEDFRESLARSAQQELRQYQTVVGPHRDEVKLALGGLPALDYCSEGQQRTIALALKVAQGEVLAELGGKVPIYLLDDIFGELDSQRRNALMELLPDQAQRLVTTTNIDWLSAEERQHWSIYTVEKGAVRAGQ